MVTSYLQNDYSRKLFLKRRQDILKQLLSLFLAIVLVVFDAKFHQNPIRQFIGSISSSLQMVVTRPLFWLSSIQEFVFGQHQLQDHNQLLKQQVLNLEYQLHQKQLQIYQYEQLKRWLDLEDSDLKFASAARLMLIQVNPNRQMYVLDEGRSQGVFEGQVAIDGHGVIGQVIDVGKYTSTLLMITDSRCAVPIINKRTGSHGVVVGKNDQNTLQLLHVPRTDQVEPGDVLMTSGLGLIYPFGIPVGVVSSVGINPGDDFLKVEVTPLAKLNKHHMVILLKSFADIQRLQQELAERLNMMEVNE